MQTGQDERKLQQHIAELESRQRELKVLNAFAISLMTISSVDELFWHVAREVVSRLGFADCVIYRCNTIENKLIQVAACGPKNPGGEAIENVLTIPIGRGITGSVAQSAEPILAQDVHLDDRYITDIVEAGSEVCVPIILDDCVYGVIDCEDGRIGHFDRHHLEVLETVAAMTASKISHCEMLEQHQRQSEIIQRVSEFVIIAENDGRIIDCNPATERAYNIKRANLLGLNIFSLYASRSGKASGRLDAAKAIQSGKSLEVRIPLKDGADQLRHFEISITPIHGPDGNLSRFVTVGREVTKQVEAEKSLQERNEVLQNMSFELRDALEQSRIAQRTQAAFLANVSHELRTPLNAIVGFSDIIKSSEVAASNPEKVSEYNQYIHAAGQHLTSLVNDILDISSLRANDSEAEHEEIHVTPMIEGCRTLINHKARKRQISIEFSPPPNDLVIIFDDRHFKQIVTNLLDNAIKFSPDNSIVSVACEIGDDGGLEISVADQGRGIEPSQIESIFTAFSRADWVRAQDVEGAGLGLALVSEMVAANGCDIGVESEPGNGATFTLYIPVDRLSNKTEGIL